MIFYLSRQNTFLFFIFFAIFESYPQFSNFVYAAVDKHVNNCRFLIISRET